MPYRAVKRAFDWTAALALLLVLAPVMALAALAIRLGSPGPVLFRQQRIGRWSGTFTIVKFRTMKTGTPDLASHLMGPGSSRVTAVGRLLRRTSIDELPQLWNILKGDMSLVGPRPALHNQDDLIAMRQAAGVDALQPGVSGWAQIHGRDGIPMAEKVERDRWYLEHCSFGLDLVILLRTAITLFSSKGVF
jgi:O-antigen biosynthesis protein WbqP